MTFKLGTHVQCAQKGLALQKLIPVHELSEIFEESRRCLETLTTYLFHRLTRENTQLTFDFLSYTPRDAWQLLKCLRPMAPLKQLCIGTGGCFLNGRRNTVFRHRGSEEATDAWFGRIEIPRGGQTRIKSLIKQESAKLVTEDPPPKSSFQFLKLPAELQYMVISHLVVEDGLIPLQSRRLTDQSIHNGYHAKRCCGHCRGFSIENDDECRCINSES